MYACGVAKSLPYAIRTALNRPSVQLDTKPIRSSNTCFQFRVEFSDNFCPCIRAERQAERMGSMFSSMNREDVEKALAKAKQIASSNGVVVFSKTYCGFCHRLKQLLSQLQAQYKVIELDEESDGKEIQAALLEWTGQRTVPNVFINGKHIGGCDAVIAKHQQGQLIPLLDEAGAMPKHSTE